jgi:hypothetical protein
MVFTTGDIQQIYLRGLPITNAYFSIVQIDSQIFHGFPFRTHLLITYQVRNIPKESLRFSRSCVHFVKEKYSNGCWRYSTHFIKCANL